LLRLLVLACAVSAIAAPAALAYTVPLPPGAETPKTFNVSRAQAIAIASRSSVVKSERKKGPLRATASPLLGRDEWQVDFLRAGDNVARASVDAINGRLIGKVWTGPQVEWPIARGIRTSFVRRLDAVVIVLSVLFAAAFVDPRRPLRLLHLDLLAFTLLSVSLLLFDHGKVYSSVPLIYPALAYLFARLVHLGFARSHETADRISWVPDAWLVPAVAALVIFRVVFSATGAVGDVGYAGMFGADSMIHGWPLYTNHPTHLDTYGPLNYLVYVPFTGLFPFNAGWTRDSLTAAHLTSVALDLVVLALLVVVGRRMQPARRGVRLGLLLTYAWAACPLTLLPLAVSANDALVPITVLLALLAFGSPLLRCAVVGLGAAAKFAPLALVPLFAGPVRKGNMRQALVAIAVAAAAFLLPFLPYVRELGLHRVWDSTLGFQLGRESPFTLWGLHPSLEWVQWIVRLLAATLIAATAFWRGERTVVRVAALAAAVILVVQSAGNYWAHTYAAWFAAPAFVALLGHPGESTTREKSATSSGGSSQTK
jgi:hypothetical protein